MILFISGGPDPVLVLQPSVSLYFVSLGEDIPDVRCRVDCNPDCEITWKKSESHVILSQIDTLSLGKAMRNSTGEYVCTATRTGTFKKGRASFFVKVPDEPGNRKMRCTYSVVFCLVFFLVFLFISIFHINLF